MMKFERFGRNAFLGYCTNVHPGTSEESIISRIQTDCFRVKNQIDPEIRFGVGMWMSANTVRRFLQPGVLARLKNACHETQIKIFSWNAFPYTDFHQPQVKNAVYYPNWSEPSRLEYTLGLLDLIQGLSDEGAEVSISTLPIAQKQSQPCQALLSQASFSLLEFVKAAYGLELDKNIQVHLNLEPEPLCALETSQDLVHYFKDYLFPMGIPILRKSFGITPHKAEEILLDKIRACYDTCHAAILYETPSDVLRQYDSIGIEVGKVQLSSGLLYRPSFTRDDHARLLLKELSKDRYLHQVVGKISDQSFEVYPDLSQALSKWNQSPPAWSEYRIHYHVPIYLKSFDCLSTTQDHIQALLRLAQNRSITRHWEVETYTWNSGEDLTARISAEINWAYRTLVNSSSERPL